MWSDSGVDNDSLYILIPERRSSFPKGPMSTFVGLTGRPASAGSQIRPLIYLCSLHVVQDLPRAVPSLPVAQRGPWLGTWVVEAIAVGIGHSASNAAS